MIIKKIILIVILSVLIIVILWGGVYYFFKKETPVLAPTIENRESEGKHPRCLKENEKIDFKIERLGEYPSIAYNKGFIEIILKEIPSGKELTKFKIYDINPDLAHTLEIHNCGIYVLRGSNFNESKSWYEKYGIWYYTYDGEGKMLISDEDYRFYSLEFRIDPHEKFIVLERGYLGLDDYALVIKNLKAKEDVFALSMKEITEQHPNLIGNFNMREWTKDGRYFWGDIFDGAYVLGYFRIDTVNWKADIFEAPEGAMGGMPLNINTGYVPIQPGLIWTGDYQLTQELKEKFRKEGKKSALYLYNLFTKEKILLETTDEPLWYFKPKWISDSELEYELPNGEKKYTSLKK